MTAGLAWLDDWRSESDEEGTGIEHTLAGSPSIVLEDSAYEAHGRSPRRPTDMALSCAPPVYHHGTPAGGRRSYHPRPPAGW
jgi:hypothetical protein